jgi:hypothetical protein
VRRRRAAPGSSSSFSRPTKTPLERPSIAVADGALPGKARGVAAVAALLGQRSARGGGGPLRPVLEAMVRERWPEDLAMAAGQGDATMVV